MTDKPTTYRGITLVPSESKARLNKRQQVDYRDHRQSLLEWMLNIGKQDVPEGYSQSTAERRAKYLDRFYRMVWNAEGRYTTTITHDHADAFIEELAYSDYSGSYKSNLQKSITMLFRWRSETFGDDPWEPERSFSGKSYTSTPRDYFTRDERAQLREAALNYGTVPHYCSITPEERSEWKRHLASRFRKPAEEIRRADFERANGFKVPSLVHTSLDAGLRPIEVERARVQWCDIENSVLRIPAKESAKNRQYWRVGIKDTTAEFLAEWIEERKLYNKYDDTDLLWLTRENNPYQSTSLKYLLEKLCEEAGIETNNRELSWYAIRHSVGTYMAREEDLSAAQTQLRHLSPMTTMKYDQTPTEDRRKALERMG